MVGEWTTIWSCWALGWTRLPSSLRRTIHLTFRLPTLQSAAPVLACRYEEYLDKQITAADIFYLEDVSLARQLVELGCVQ